MKKNISQFFYYQAAVCLLVSSTARKSDDLRLSVLYTDKPYLILSISTLTRIYYSFF